MVSTLSREIELATRLARAGGAIATQYLAHGVEVETKSGGEPVTAADRAVNAHIVDALREAFPDDAVLAEESPPDPRRFATSRTWIVDPIDGTREYIAGTTSWDVLIGLVVEGEPVLGVVFNPPTDTLYGAIRGGGTTVERPGRTEPLVIRDAGESPLRVAIREGRDDDVTREILRALDPVEPVIMPALGARVIEAIARDTDIVLHTRGSAREWDTCAIQVVVEEAGGVMLNCLGQAPAYIKEDLVQPHGLFVGRRRAVELATPSVVQAYGRTQDEGITA